MANIKKLSAVLLLLCGLLCLCLLAGCEISQPTEPSTTLTTEAPEVIYTISVKTAGGLMLDDDVHFYVYDSAARNYIVEHGPMKEDGLIIFTAPRSDKYILVLKDVPQGYDVQSEYVLKTTKLDIVLNASVVTEGNVTDRAYKPGDVFTDFTITDTDGNTYTLSEILKTKKAVVLNFWFINCGPCKAEFPYLQKAYDLYKDQLEVIAINAEATETEGQVAQFRQENGYTFPMAKVDESWKKVINYASSPTTLIIDRYGVVCLIETGKVDQEGVFEGTFNHFTSENYQQKLVDRMEDLDTLEFPEGHKRNPKQTSAAVDQFQLSLEPGQEFYCNISRCDGILLHVEKTGIYVMYEGRRHDADENGVIEFELTCKDTNSYAQVIFVNESEEAQSFLVELKTPPGTISTPIDMTYGELSVLLEQGRDQGLYYKMTADKTGFIHLKVTGVSDGADYEIQIDNMNTMLSILFSTGCVEDVDGNYVAVVPVTAMDELRIAFTSMPDKTGAYPEMTIQTLVSYSEHGGVGTLEEIDYSLTFKDVEGLPMAGVTATFTVNGQAVVLISDENGQITTKLPEGSYMVQLVFPQGFTADATQYLLTPEDSSKEIVLRLHQQKDITYTIHVQDHDGLPVVGAFVTVGSNFVRTDENGNAVFVLPAGNYVATIVPPEGYVSKESKYPFGVRPDVTIVLENNQSTTKVPYTVTVLDGFGDPFTNVVVRFYAADGTVTTVVVSADGVASTSLIRGNYTVELVFQQSNMYYERVDLQLTAEKTSTTIVVAPGLTGQPGQVKPTTSSSTFDAYYINVGSVYVEMQPMSLTYFLFKPTKPGLYKIYTNKTGAAIENWQTTTQTTPNASGVQDNVFTLEVKEVGKTYVIAIDAAYDITNAILTVFRAPDCVVDAYPVTPNLPEMPYTPGLPTEVWQKYLHYMDFTSMHALVLGEDGYYHLDTEDGPIVLVDLMGERYGVSIQKLLDAGDMAWFTYDEEGYPIYKKDYTDCMKAYLAIMEPTKGLYPLTDDLYAMIKDYGDHAGWWDPNSSGYLFASLADGVMLPDAAWMFLTCYIYIDQNLCEHNFSEWVLNTEGTAMTRSCPYCELTETHVLGSDCGMDTAGEWTLNMETLSYTSTCTICGQAMSHVINTDCDDSTCKQWVLSEDGTFYERLCQICHSLHQHVVGTDCREEHYSQWVLSADGINYERSCTICGKLEQHIAGTDCRDEHYSQWVLSADGVNYECSCTICGNLKQHITGTDCGDATGTEWVATEDGLGYERNCTICGTLQKHTTGMDCSDATCGEWTATADGRGYERTCTICATVQKHATGINCGDHYDKWTNSENGLTATRSCTICGNTQVHTVGDDCGAHFNQWTKSKDGLTASRSCTICGHTQVHTVGTDCEAHYSAWNKSENGLTATRFCNICGHTQTHSVGADCESHYGQWIMSEDGKSYTRICPICTNTQTHVVGTDCEGHYSQWTKNEDGLTVTRTCAVCGNVQTHTIGSADCESHYSQWTKSEDGLTYTRTCAACGNVQTHAAGTDCGSSCSEWTKNEGGTVASCVCTVCGYTRTHNIGPDCVGHYGQWTNSADGVNQERVCEICGNKQTQPIPAVDPEDPADPETPADPEDPVDPETPADPEDPVDPETPVDPENPATPETPEEPQNPSDPEAPENPVPDEG